MTGKTSTGSSIFFTGVPIRACSMGPFLPELSMGEAFQRITRQGHEVRMIDQISRLNKDIRRSQRCGGRYPVWERLGTPCALAALEPNDMRGIRVGQRLSQA